MDQKPKFLTILDYITVVFMLIAISLVFFYAPVEKVMGLVQKVFYFHVATAWVGMLGFLSAAIAGVFYLMKGEKKYDIAGLAAVEISLVFFFIAIIMGSIWARPAWNAWWTWDPRLTTAAIVEIIYLAYLMLRSGIEDPDRRARFGAVYTLLGFISVPLTFFVIRRVRTIHPVVIGAESDSGEGGFSMTSPMKLTFFFSLFTFSVLYVTVFWHRIRLGKLAHKIENLRLKQLS